MEQLEAFYTMLSPRTRRSPLYIPQNQPTGLNIPAHAEVIPVKPHQITEYYEYPRARGGDPKYSLVRVRNNSLSPQTRR